MKSLVAMFAFKVKVVLFEWISVLRQNFVFEGKLFISGLCRTLSFKTVWWLFSGYFQISQYLSYTLQVIV